MNTINPREMGCKMMGVVLLAVVQALTATPVMAQTIRGKVLEEKTRYGETVQTNYRSDKFDVFAYLNYLHANDYETEDSRYDVRSRNPFELNSTLKKNIRRNRYTGKVGFDYYFTQRQNIGAYYQYTYNNLHTNGEESLTVNQMNQTSDDQDYRDHSTLSSPAHQVNAYYAGHIGPVDINFNNDFHYSSNRQSQLVEGTSVMHGAQHATTSNKLRNCLAASDLSLQYAKGMSVWKIGTTYNHIRRTNDYVS